MLSDEEMLARMENGWQRGKPFTVCGNGSLPEYTANVRRVLPQWTKQYDLHVVNDAGAGDLRWMEGMRWDGLVEYRAFDLIPRLPFIHEFDITRDTMPPCDLILCRMVLNHIQPRVEQALARFRASGRYLAATQYGPDAPQRTKEFYRLDLSRWLGEPLESVQDGPEEFGVLALWKL